MAYFAEHPTNPEFATVGDALWWGIVTMTTVGYGDIVPKTSTGRWAAVVIMLTGVAVLGLLAGSLASFFRLDKGAAAGGEVADGDASAEAGPSDAAADPATALGALVTEVAALRQQVALLSEHVAGLGTPRTRVPVVNSSTRADPPAPCRLRQCDPLMWLRSSLECSPDRTRRAARPPRA